MSGMMGTIAQGMAFGTGSAIAHRAVGAAAGAMSGGSEDEVAAPQQYQQSGLEQQLSNPQAANNCELDKNNFFDCLKANNGDANNCRFFMDAMKQCQSGNAGGQMMNSTTFN